MSERQVHEAAEDMYERYGDDPPIYADDDPRSIAFEVVSQLSILNHQLITPTDIPALIAFLATPAGQDVHGWATWRGYWGAIDFEQRARTLADNPYYATTPPPKDP